MYDVVTAIEQIDILLLSGKDNLTILSQVLAKEITDKDIQNGHFIIRKINDTIVFQFNDRNAYLSLYYGK
jgi:hypothetical protein